jgi:eukaryotic-like serine/threonine-protein kinase
VLQRLGRGGFGTTYLAEDEDKLKERCVVKQLTPNVQGTWAMNKAVELFKQEAEQLQKLGSEHLQIPSLSAYFDQDGYLYLVQQYIDGLNLFKLLQQQGVLRESEIRQLLLDLLPVLKFIHSRGVIHRDIKPENIMRRRDNGQPVLIDFGVSKQLSQTVMAKPGTNIGSQGYAPIEQMQDGEAYPASDLFSLGASCFQLLTGVHPYRLWTEHGYGWTANWRQYLRGSVSDDLGRVLDKLLQKERQYRYLSAEEVLRDLQQQSAPPKPKPPQPAPPQPVPTTPNGWTRRDLINFAGFAGLGWLAFVIFGEKFGRNESGQETPTTSPQPRPRVTSTPEITLPPEIPVQSTPTQTPRIIANRFQFEVVNVNAQGNIINRSNKQAEFFRDDLGNGVFMDMVFIPNGTFQMGSPDREQGRDNDEGPQRRVTVASFSMGKYAVTQAQWEAVAALPQINLSLNPNPSAFKGANRPVEKVSWNEAMEFCARLAKKTGRAYRLPSEAEWEYACRAGTTTPFYFGETITTDLVNYDGDYTYGNAPKGIDREQTTDVGSFPPNAFGLYDMHGNVWEWCADAWHENYQGAPSDGRVWEGGDDKYRMHRGGSWDYYPLYCRCAYRYRYRVVVRYDSLGFRVAVVSGLGA